eukprot:TRINITY_DN377731_c0_g1_i1.p1 TRINITY_DN377731_c0_g1~~TRINITY_DN377731_c0_g1_i1.p1  ORF type:complete len:176 (+),score=26.50 TRINITY_DN377731_c0_g1_i1:82-609(+)
MEVSPSKKYRLMPKSKTDSIEAEVKTKEKLVSLSKVSKKRAADPKVDDSPVKRRKLQLHEEARINLLCNIPQIKNYQKTKKGRRPCIFITRESIMEGLGATLDSNLAGPQSKSKSPAKPVDHMKHVKSLIAQETAREAIANGESDIEGELVTTEGTDSESELSDDNARCGASESE